MNQKPTPLVGILFFVLLLGSVLTGSNQNPDTSGAKVLSYATAHHDKLVASMILTILAVFTGVIYFGVLRDYLRRDADVRGLTATAFGGVILFAASGALSAGALIALTSTSHLDPSVAQMLNLIETNVVTGLDCAGLAVLLFTYGIAIVRSGLLPRWLGWVALPFAAVALFPWVATIAFAATGLWVVATSIAIYRQGKSDGVAKAASVQAASA